MRHWLVIEQQIQERAKPNHTMLTVSQLKEPTPFDYHHY